MYAYAPTGTVEQTHAELPDSWTLTTGESVSGFDEMTPEQQKDEGWYPIVDDFAVLGPDQHHGEPVYTVRTDDVLATYPAEDDSAETVNEKAIVANLEADLELMQAIVDDTNANINANPAARIKEIARMNKRLGRTALNDYSEAD